MKEKLRKEIKEKRVGLNYSLNSCSICANNGN